MYFSFHSRCKPTRMLQPVCNSMDLRADFHIEWQSFFFLFATNFDTSSNEMKEWKLKNQNYLFFPRWKKKSGVDVGITRWRTSGFGLLERWRNQWVHFASSPKILFGAAKETDWVQPWFSVWFLFFCFFVCLVCLSCLLSLRWHETPQAFLELQVVPSS